MGWTTPIVVTAAAAGLMLLAGTGKQAKQAEPVDHAKEARFQTVVAGARWLKSNAKNPASFELARAVMVDSQTICYEYRGTNSFNAVVLNRRVISNAVNSGEDRDWNKHCAGRDGEDFTYARQAL
jgi:uncharacterized protein (DUF924 family)